MGPGEGGGDGVHRPPHSSPIVEAHNLSGAGGNGLAWGGGENGAGGGVRAGRNGAPGASGVERKKEFVPRGGNQSGVGNAYGAGPGVQVMSHEPHNLGGAVRRPLVFEGGLGYLSPAFREGGGGAGHAGGHVGGLAGGHADPSPSPPPLPGAGSPDDPGLNLAPSPRPGLGIQVMSHGPHNLARAWAGAGAGTAGAGGLAGGAGALLGRVLTPDKHSRSSHSSSSSGSEVRVPGSGSEVRMGSSPGSGLPRRYSEGALLPRPASDHKPSEVAHPYTSTKIDR